MSMTTARRTTRDEYLAAHREMWQRPGEWVEIPTREKNAQQHVYRCRAGGVAAFPPEEFEFELIDGKPMARYRRR